MTKTSGRVRLIPKSSDLVTVTDPKEIARLDAILLPFSQNAHWYTDHFEGIETTPKYKGRYVVVVNQKIVGYGKNLPRLRVRLIARGVNMRSAYAEFVNFKRGTEILSKAA